MKNVTLFMLLAIAAAAQTKPPELKTAAEITRKNAPPHAAVATAEPKPAPIDDAARDCAHPSTKASVSLEFKSKADAAVEAIDAFASQLGAGHEVLDPLQATAIAKAKAATRAADVAAERELADRIALVIDKLSSCRRHEDMKRETLYWNHRANTAGKHGVALILQDRDNQLESLDNSRAAGDRLNACIAVLDCEKDAIAGGMTAKK